MNEYHGESLVRQRGGLVLDRRGFIGAVAGGLLAKTDEVGAQLTAKPFRIGTLDDGAKDFSLLRELPNAMRELGWTEGTTFVVERRFADHRTDRLPDLATELVNLNVDVIVTSGTLPALAAKRATSTVPIVMFAAGDPLGSGIVSNLARPGGNITGTSLNSTELAGKRLQLLKELVRGMSSVAVLWNQANPFAARVFADTKAASSTFGIRIQSLPVNDSRAVGQAIEAAVRAGAGGLMVVEDRLTEASGGQIADFAARNRLPAMYGLRMFVDAGGLMSYGADLRDLLRRSALYVDKIFRGVKPGELPIEQPTRFRLVINLRKV
jgi:putative ABC transport system substrate-binding protein